MFEPPDFPFKELSEFRNVQPVLSESDTSVQQENTSDRSPLIRTKDPVQTDEATKEDVQTGVFLNIESGVESILNTSLEGDQSSQLFVLQASAMLGFDATLLDNNTVVLPLEVAEGQKKADEAGALVALQACPLCRDLFTSPADLWEHSVAAHYTEYIITGDDSPTATAGPTALVPSPDDSINIEPEGPDQEVVTSLDTENSAGAEDQEEHATEWLICSVCERVLSTAGGEAEAAAAENLCCSEGVEPRYLATLFVCEKCSALFASGESFSTHQATCDQQPLQLETQQQEPNKSSWYQCDACQQSYRSTDDLLAHLPGCAGATTSDSSPAESLSQPRRLSSPPATGKMWNCGSCNQLFITARELYRHKRGEDRSEGAAVTAYICAVCDKPLGSVCALHTHRKTHAVSKPGYSCGVCARRFNQSGHLAIHMRMHTGERPYPCDLCPKAFKVKVERDDHRRTHTGERPFECPSCAKTFTAAARLREHSRIHTDQRPYRCEVCGAAFRRPYARTVHALIHTGQKPHACDLCGTAFRRSGDMWKHKRTMHGVSADSKS